MDLLEEKVIYFALDESKINYDLAEIIFRDEDYIEFIVKPNGEKYIINFRYKDDDEVCYDLYSCEEEEIIDSGMYTTPKGVYMFYSNENEDFPIDDVISSICRDDYNSFSGMQESWGNAYLPNNFSLCDDCIEISEDTFDLIGKAECLDE